VLYIEIETVTNAIKSFKLNNFFPC
jgi:hypothetical protein